MYKEDWLIQCEKEEEELENRERELRKRKDDLFYTWCQLRNEDKETADDIESQLDLISEELRDVRNKQYDHGKKYTNRRPMYSDLAINSFIAVVSFTFCIPDFLKAGNDIGGWINRGMSFAGMLIVIFLLFHLVNKSLEKIYRSDNRRAIKATLVMCLWCIGIFALYFFVLYEGDASSQEAKTEPQLTTYSQDASVSDYIYVTGSGEKYHRSDCRYVNDSSERISLEDAIDRGYTPCSVCNPPRP